jgi:hypothetical protein
MTSSMRIGSTGFVVSARVAVAADTGGAAGAAASTGAAGGAAVAAAGGSCGVGCDGS